MHALPGCRLLKVHPAPPVDPLPGRAGVVACPDLTAAWPAAVGPVLLLRPQRPGHTPQAELQIAA